MSPAELRKLEAEITALMADLEFYSYYQLLDVKPDAQLSVIQYNYNLKTFTYQEAKKSPLCKASLQSSLSTLIFLLEEALKVLSDPKLRAEYDRGLDLGHLRHEPKAGQRARKDRGADKKHLDQLLEQVKSGEFSPDYSAPGADEDDD